MQPTWLPIAIAAPLIAFAVYRRVIGLTTRQEVRRGTMLTRMALLTVVGTMLLVTSFTWLGLAAALGGAAVGVVLSFVSASRTTYELQDGAVYYMPFRWIGLVVTGLFLCRLAMRLYEVSQLGVGTPGHYGPGTLAIFFLLVGYYVSYFAAVMRRASTMLPVRS